MTLIGALLTALLMAREWERGTMEALLVTPVSMSEILLGKILPYFVLGMGGLGLSVVMGVWLFEVPLRGSIWVLLLGSSLFLFTATGHGIAYFDGNACAICRGAGRHYHDVPACIHLVRLFI